MCLYGKAGKRRKAKVQRQDTVVKGRRLMGVCMLVCLFVSVVCFLWLRACVTYVRANARAPVPAWSASPAVCKNAVRELMWIPLWWLWSHPCHPRHVAIHHHSAERSTCTSLWKPPFSRHICPIKELHVENWSRGTFDRVWQWMITTCWNNHELGVKEWLGTFTESLWRWF